MWGSSPWFRHDLPDLLRHFFFAHVDKTPQNPPLDPSSPRPTRNSFCVGIYFGTQNLHQSLLWPGTTARVHEKQQARSVSSSSTASHLQISLAPTGRKWVADTARSRVNRPQMAMSSPPRLVSFCAAHVVQKQHCERRGEITGELRYVGHAGRGHGPTRDLHPSSCRCRRTGDGENEGSCPAAPQIIRRACTGEPFLRDWVSASVACIVCVVYAVCVAHVSRVMCVSRVCASRVRASRVCASGLYRVRCYA